MDAYLGHNISNQEIDEALSTALINALTLNWTDHCELALRS